MIDDINNSFRLKDMNKNPDMSNEVVRTLGGANLLNTTVTMLPPCDWYAYYCF